MAGQGEPEKFPPHLGQVVEEDSDRVEEGAQGAQARWSVAGQDPRHAPAATRTQSVAKPSSRPTSSIQLTSFGIP